MLFRPSSHLSFAQYLQDAATTAVRHPGDIHDAAGTRKYVVRTLEEAQAKWREECLKGEVAKLDR
jgi:hypothetical protein